MQVIEQVFDLTAGQELAHAMAFYRQMEPCAGETVGVDGSYPVDLAPEVLEQLRAAHHNEYREYEHDYTGFAKVAKEEGFPVVSHLFSDVARIEQVHGDRFGVFADLLETGKLFVSEVETDWICLHCGHIVRGSAAPAVCPVCRRPQGYFVRYALSPYAPGRC